jgi:putative transcriptional regulator
VSNQLAPGLLIASPPLGDPNFDRTVVLLAIHNAHGALGFVVNRLAPLQLGELLGLAGYGEGAGGEPLGAVKGSVYVGGPVEPSSGWVLGTRAELGLATRDPMAGPAEASPSDEDGVIPVGERLVVTSSRVVFDEVARRARAPRPGGLEAAPAARRLVLLGYSGWGPGQLEGEIAHGSWLPAPLDERILFETDVEARWERTYASLGLSALGAIAMRTVGEA